MNKILFDLSSGSANKPGQVEFICWSKPYCWWQGTTKYPQPRGESRDVHILCPARA